MKRELGKESMVGVGSVRRSFEVRTSVHLLAAGLFFMSLIGSGCGGGPNLGKAVDVTGKITLNGAPVADAQVTFHAMEGLPAEYRTRKGKTDSEGVYEVSDVYEAEYNVMVEKFDSGEVDPSKALATFEPSPLSKFESDTPLRAKVKQETTEFDFKLEDY